MEKRKVRCVFMLTGLVLAFVLGMAVAWYGPKAVEMAAAKEPVSVVKNYLQYQSQGDQTEAIRYLTGEAEQVIGAKQNAYPDPIRQVDILSAAIHGDLAQVRVRWVSSQDELTEDFYLVRLNDGWKIFSMQVTNPDWEGMKRTELTPAHRKVIENYTAAVARGNVRQAMEFLAGSARIRASRVPVSVPQQTIEVTEVRPVGKLTGGEVMVMASETIKGVQTVQETLLYTLSPVGGEWKISDVRLVERHAE